MHKTKNNKFFRLWRYKIKIQLYNVCILSDIWLKVANYILRSSNVQYLNWGASDVEYSRFDGQLIECRKSDIRRRALRMSNIRHSTMQPIESKKSDPTNKANRIEFSTFDSTECTRLIPICKPMQTVNKPEDILKFCTLENK